MNVLSFILAIVAVVLFCLAAFGVAARVNLIALGLAVLTVAWIVALTVSGSLVHL